MKKTIYFLMVCLTLVSSSVFAGEDLFNTGGLKQFRVVSDGGVRCSSVVVTGNISVTGGIVNVVDSWIDIPTSSSGSIRTDFALSTTTAQGTTTYTSVDITQLVYGRNVIGVIEFPFQTSTMTATATLLVTGVNTKGASATETVTISTQVADGVGNVAFDRITSIAVTLTAYNQGTNQGTIRLFIGSGNKIGLSNNITATTDIYKVIEAGSDVAPTTPTISATYDTITFSSAPNGSRDYTVKYSASSR